MKNVNYAVFQAYLLYQVHKYIIYCLILSYFTKI